jgi:peptidoglycan/xylan/chitin deacetylase (PgdA/CDA1 family)
VPTLLPEATPLPDADIPAIVAGLPPLPTPQPGGAYAARVPILMYHYVSDPPEDADIYRTDLSVSPAEFRKQLAYLQDAGFTTIDLYDLARALANQAPLPDRPIVLTFDDGYRDNYINAFPILKEYGMHGTFFIVTDFVTSENEGYMTWQMVEEMARAGMRMEIHTRWHPTLVEQEPEFVVDQIVGAQQALAAHIDHVPRFLAYPGGSYDDDVLDIVKGLDLWGAVTTKWGSYHEYRNRYEMKRMRMRYTTTLPVFIDIVNLRDP